MPGEARDYEVGEKVGGYEVKRREPLDHLHGTYYELVHGKTGARHIHIARPDDNNAFVVSFPTVPKDSTGVAHILEHVVLAGSEKFPVKDPFFSMIPRSLKTFMNALTSHDATAYPFSTRNKKDFFNLLDVYLDATFFPKIEERAFRQEGHRLEFDRLEGSSSRLRYKGVVFNEMKAANASPQRAVYEALGKALFPHLTYANNSGGDPEVMPQLTWEQLRQFHATHYHPSNAYFFTCGDLALEEILPAIDSYISKFERRQIDVSIEDQKRYKEPIVFEASYPLPEDEDPSKKGQGLVAWITANTADSFEVLALKILREVLLGNAASPLHKALIDSGLGEALADGTGFLTNYREAVFAAGLKGIDPKEAQKVERVVLDTLEDLADQGLDREKVDAAIHQLEIQSREISNAGFPYSLKVFFQLRAAYLYGGDPYKLLHFDEDVERLRREVEEGSYLEKLMRKHMIDNSHRARIVVSGDQAMEKKARDAELGRLAAIEREMTDHQKEALVSSARAIKEFQEAKEDVSVLPTLELSDVPMEFEDVPHNIEESPKAKIGWFPQPTNGITYIDVQSDFSGLPDDLKATLPLFQYALTRSGAAGLDYLEMASRIDRFTGGVSAGAGVFEIGGTDGFEFRQTLTLRGKALARNHGPFVSILKDIVASAQFEPQRLKELIGQYKAQSESMVVTGAVSFVRSLAASKLTPARSLAERLDGLAMVKELRRLAALDRLEGVIEELNAIREFLYERGPLHICVTTEEVHFQELESLVNDLATSLPTGEPESGTGADPVTSPRHEARTHSVPVAFNAKVFKTVGFGHDDAPALAVLAPFIRATYLHREIREKGGAYGGTPVYSRDEGLFAFLSWRDPNVARTFQVFESAVQEVIKGEIEPDDLKEAILSASGAADPLLSPDTKGRVRFYGDLAGYTIQAKANFKKRLLEVDEADLRRVAEAYLSNSEPVMATLSNPEKIEEANAEMGGIFEVSPALE